MFSVNGIPYKVSEAAKYILEHSNAAETCKHGIGIGQDGSLAKHVKAVGDPVHNDYLTAALGIAETTVKESQNPHWLNWRNQVAASVFLSLLAGNTGRLIINGIAMDRAWLASLIEGRRDPKDIGLAVRAIVCITESSIIERIRLASAQETADAFETTGAIIRHVQAFSKDHPELIDLRDSNVVLKLIKIATKDPSALIAEANEIRSNFPASSNSTVTSLLGSPMLSCQALPGN